MARWEQVGGDVNPKEYGAVLARVEGSSVEIIEIDPDDEKEGWYYVITGDFDKSDLAWNGQANPSGIASSIGASKAEWEEMNLAQKAASALAYHGSNWSQGGPERVKGWTNALNNAVGSSEAASIKWWR